MHSDEKIARLSPIVNLLEFPSRCGRFRLMDRRNMTRSLLVGALAINSMDTLLIRLAGSSPAVPFYRAFFCFLSLLAIVSIFRVDVRSALKRDGLGILIAALLMASSSMSFPFAVQKAGSSITLIYFALSSCFAAVFSYLWLREKPSKVTVLAILLSILGVVWMNRRGLGSVPLSYHLLALVSPVAGALSYTFQRRHQLLDRRVICTFGTLISTLSCLFIARGSIQISPSSLLPLMAVGFAIVPIGQLSRSFATRYIPSFEVSLINGMEGVFGLVWVFLVLGERPSGDALAGAALIFAAVIMNNLQDMRGQYEEQ